MDDLPSYPGTPRWVKMTGIVAGILALLLVIACSSVAGATVLVATCRQVTLAAAHCPPV